MVPGQWHSPCQPLQMRGFPRFWGLLQLFLCPSLQVHGKCLDALLCQSQIIRNLRTTSGSLCLDTTCQHFYSSAYATVRGRRIVYDLLVFLILTQDEGEFASAFGSHIISLLYPSPGKNSLLRVPNATSNPLYSLLLCQHPQFTGEISEAQRGKHTSHDHTTCYLL